jgi:hypothetical protein
LYQQLTILLFTFCFTNHSINLHLNEKAINLTKKSGRWNGTSVTSLTKCFLTIRQVDMKTAKHFTQRGNHACRYYTKVKVNGTLLITMRQQLLPLKVSKYRPQDPTLYKTFEVITHSFWKHVNSMQLSEMWMVSKKSTQT